MAVELDTERFDIPPPRRFLMPCPDPRSIEAAAEAFDEASDPEVPRAIMMHPLQPCRGSPDTGRGGTFTGMILTSLRELNGYFLLQRYRVPSKVAVATSVFVVMALVATTGHAVQFFRGDPARLAPPLAFSFSRCRG